MSIRRILTALLLLSGPAAVYAGEPAVTIDGAVVVSSAYLWRGEQVCGLHFNPDVALHFGDFTVEQYSFLATDGSYKEIDWDLSYSLGNFTFHLADYYWHYAAGGPENFFSWKKGATNHIDEAAIVYECGSIPFKATWFTFFWGDWVPDGAGNPGRLSLSSYLELEAWKDFGQYGRGTVNLGFSVLKGSYTGYSKAFMPIHAELRYGKSFDFGKFAIPVGVNYVINPYRNICMAGASIGIEF